MSLTVNKLLMKPLLGATVLPVALGENASAGHTLYPNASSQYLKADADAANKWRGVCILINGVVGQLNNGSTYSWTAL